MGVASLVLGILSIIIGFFTGIWGAGGWGAILGIIGIILGAVARRNPEQNGIGTAGLICSIIGLIFSLLFWIACAACVGSLALMR